MPTEHPTRPVIMVKWRSRSQSELNAKPTGRGASWGKGRKEGRKSGAQKRGRPLLYLPPNPTKTKPPETADSAEHSFPSCKSGIIKRYGAGFMFGDYSCLDSDNLSISCPSGRNQFVNTKFTRHITKMSRSRHYVFAVALLNICPPSCGCWLTW